MHPWMQVDAFELAVETPPAVRVRAEAAPLQPSPQEGGAQAVALAAAAPTPGTAHRQRPMSLGLSRRRSSMAPWAHTALASSSKANASPLKLANLPGAAERWVLGRHASCHLPIYFLTLCSLLHADYYVSGRQQAGRQPLVSRAKSAAMPLVLAFLQAA